MIPRGLPVYVALEAVDMRMGIERLGGWVRDRLHMEPLGQALFVFVGKRGNSMKVLTADGSGVIVVNKRLNSGRFELPVATAPGQDHLVVSDALFAAIFAGTVMQARRRKRKLN